MTAADPPEEPGAPGQTPRRLLALVVDDEESMRHFLVRGLKRLGFDASAVGDGDAALAAVTQQDFDLVALDLRMPGLDGLAVLARIQALPQPPAVVLMTAHGNVAHAVEAMKLGAADFLQKPFEIEELHLRIDRALELRAMRRDNRELRAQLRGAGGPELLASSAAMRQAVRQMELVAGSDATTLLLGESGTGKGMLARAIHAASPRKDGPFIAVNCPAIPDALFESTMFGHEPGAFTGATERKQGLCARADSGTLFLDELAELSLPAQAKLERFLQDREYLPLGGSKPLRADVRVLAATNQDLEQLCEQGRFRRELLWRLQVVTLPVPPLRQRREDVPLLVLSGLRRLQAKAGRGPGTMTAEALAALSAYDWPGNVRELENLTERMAVLAGDREVLGVGDLPAELRGLRPTEALGDYEAARRQFDQAYFSALLVRSGGSITEAARLGGLSRGHLHRRLRELDLDANAARLLDAPPDHGAG